MLNNHITSGDIWEDIGILSEIDLHDDWVNKFVSSLVLKYIQEYFQARDILEWLSLLQERLDAWGGWIDLFYDNVNEAYPLECLGNIDQTSAILKEIIFNDGYQAEQEFRSCDLGSGAWILSLGAYISWLRKWLKKGKLYLADHENNALQKSKRVLQSLVESSFEVNTILGDITSPQIFEQIGEEKIQFWISETITMNTPNFQVSKFTKSIRMTYEDLMSYELTGMLDPFPQVFANIARSRPDFEHDVESGNVAFFPDFINGLYKPDINGGTLRLKTWLNNDKPLFETWNEFEYIRPFNLGDRWADMEAMKQELWIS